MSAEIEAALRERIAKAIRQSLWAEWGAYVPDGDESLASLGGTAQEGYLRSADAVLAALFADGARLVPADVVEQIVYLTNPSRYWTIEKQRATTKVRAWLAEHEGRR